MGTVDVPVVVIGGGLTGAATAYVFAAAGLRVALLEADRLGGGGRRQCRRDAPPAGRRLHRARGQPRPPGGARPLASHPPRRARGSGDAAAAPHPFGPAAAHEVVFAATSEQARRLAREASTRRQAGLDASGLTAKGLAALGLEGVTGIRTKGHVR